MVEIEQFEKAVLRFKEELGRLRANRAVPTLVEGVRVEAYGSNLSLQEVASITAPEPQMLLIQPWDKSILKAIETSLRTSEIGVQPVVDGDIIRLPFPPLTEEKRKELVKMMLEKVEETRIVIRKTREELLKGLKQQEKGGEISEDEYFREEKEIQQLVNQFNERVKQMAEVKEKELLTI